MVSTETKEIFSTEFPGLLARHLDQLYASAISADVIRERGYKSVTKIVPGKTKDDEEPYDESPGAVSLGAFGFKQTQLLVPSLLIPMYGVEGSVVLHQLRPDKPRISQKTEKPIKYETPANRTLRIDVPPRCRKDIDDPAVPLFITEGAKKADALASAGVCAINVPGVWGWKGTNEKGGKTILADFDRIAFNDGRLVYLAFDSDIITKPAVKQALDRLTEHLVRKGAKVKSIYLPQGVDNAKTGVDDYLATGHTMDEVFSLAQEASKPKITRVDEGFKSLYHIIDHRITVAKQASDGGTDYIPQADFAAQISAIITRDNGKDKDKFFHIIGVDEKGKPLPQIDIPATEFDSLSWVTKHWDVQAVLGSDAQAKAKVRQFILVNSKEAQRMEVYTHTGWRDIHGTMAYLTNGGAINGNGTLVDLDNDLADYSLPKPVDDPREALEASLGFLKVASKRIALPLWAAMYLAPLNPFVDTCFTIFITGISGAGKSGLTGFALNHFGPDFNYNRLPGSWTTTENKLEMNLFLTKDAPFIIDDYAPPSSTSKARAMEEKADQIFRSQANRQGRGRMTKDIVGRVTHIPRGLLITTGEHIPPGQSNNARLFVMDMKKSDFNPDAFFAALKTKHLLSQAMSNYIAWISKRWDELKKELPQMEREWYLQALDSSKHARLPAAVAKLYAGLTMGLQFMVEYNVISKKEAQSLAAEGWQVLLTWTSEQAKRVELQRPAWKFLEGLIALINNGQAVFRSIDDTEPQAPKPGQTAIGWRDKELNYLLDPKTAYATVKRFLSSAEEPLTFNEDAIWNDLEALGFSECNYGRKRFQVRIYGKRLNVIKIKKNAIDEAVKPDSEQISFSELSN